MRRGCIIYDGTTRLGEATAALWRQCNSKFLLQTRLVAFRTTEKHMSGEELYRLLSTILLGDLGKQPDELIVGSVHGQGVQSNCKQRFYTFWPRRPEAPDT